MLMAYRGVLLTFIIIIYTFYPEVCEKCNKKPRGSLLKNNDMFFGEISIIFCFCNMFVTKLVI